MPQPTCKCGLPASWRTVQKEGPNHARNFWSCPKPPSEACPKFFVWAAPGDLPPAPQPSSHFISRLSQGNHIPGGGMIGGGGVAVGGGGTPSRQGTVAMNTGSGGKYGGGGGGSMGGGAASVVVKMELCRVLPEPEVMVKHGFNERLISMYKTLPSRRYDPEARSWAFPLSALEDLHRMLQAQPGVVIEPIPSSVLKGLRSAPMQHLVANLRSDNQAEEIDTTLQIDGIRFIIKRGGRGLLGDEMGLGKTLQAIGIMCYYRHLWPALIIMPSGLRHQWRDKLLEWMGEESLSKKDICVIDKGSDKITGEVVIVSYDLAIRLSDDGKIKQGQFQVVVADESHYLKSQDAKRTKAVVPLLQKATVAVCLSGTPAVSRPMELYTQLNALHPCLFSDARQFSVRYCNGHEGRFGWDATGSSHEKELKLLLDALVMIRRMKKEALAEDLPPKQRQYVTVAVDPAISQEINAKIKEKESVQREMSSGGGLDPATLESLNFRLQAITSKLYALTGLSKVGGALDYLKQHVFFTPPDTSTDGAGKAGYADEVMVVDEEEDEDDLLLPQRSMTETGELITRKRKRGEGRGSTSAAASTTTTATDASAKWPKVVLFAHHSEVLDQLEVGLASMGCNTVRIDGSITGAKRYEAQERFQKDPGVHAAILSITACAMGLNLTSASMAVFVELHWVPGILFQAEDRIHRVGQMAEVVHYLYMISDGTIDKQMWDCMKKKEEVLSNTTGMSEAAKGQWSALQVRPHITSLDPAMYSPPKPPLKQSRLTEYTWSSPSKPQPPPPPQQQHQSPPVATSTVSRVGSSPPPLPLSSSPSLQKQASAWDSKPAALPSSYSAAAPRGPSSLSVTSPPSSTSLAMGGGGGSSVTSGNSSGGGVRPAIPASYLAARAQQQQTAPPAPAVAAAAPPMEPQQMKEMIEKKRQAALALRAKVMEDKARRAASLAASGGSSGGGGGAGGRPPSSPPPPPYQQQQQQQGNNLNRDMYMDRGSSRW